MTTNVIKKQFLVTIIAFFTFLVLGTFNHVQAAATLYFTASTTGTYVGQTFTVYPRVNTGGDSTNAYSVQITFPSGLIQPISISKGGSVCTLFTQEPSYTASTATISCGLPNPGYNGSSGSLGSITFRARAKGSATISISGGSQVLANDGAGTNILGTRSSITINITDPPPPPINSPVVTCSPGSDNEWIVVNEVTCSWTVPSGAMGYSYTLTQDQSTSAGRTNLGSETSKTYSDLEDGVYYFKIAATDGSRWSNDATYTLLIDTTPPKDLEIVSEPSNESVITILPFISFNAIDDTSGIDHYEIKIDNGEYIVTDSPYQIESITGGEHTITIKTFDKAGNYTEESITLTIVDVPPPVIIKPKDGSYIPIGEEIYIEGTATPNSIIYIYLNGELIAEVTSNEDGYFSYTYDQFLLQGKYELYAILKNENGIISEKSETVTFNIDPRAIRIGNLVIPGHCLSLSIIFIILLLILVIICLLKKPEKCKIRNIINQITKKSKKIGKVIKKKFRKKSQKKEKLRDKGKD